MEQRSDRRFEQYQPVTITFVERDGVTNWGRFIDLSNDVMSIRVNVPVQSGEVVKLDIGAHQAIANVRECTNENDSYHATLETLRWANKSELRGLKVAVAMNARMMATA